MLCGARVVLAVRSERIRVLASGETGDNLLPGRVRTGLYLGATYQYVVDTDEGPALEVKRNDEWLAWVTSVRALGELVPLDQLVQLPAEA